MHSGKIIIHALTRLKELQGVKTDQEISDCLGISRSALANHKVKGSIPYKVIATHCDKKGISLNWILYGKGSKYIEKENYQKLNGSNAINTGDDYYLVPKYNVEATAGKGDIYFEEEIIDHLAFSKKWIKKAGLVEEKLSIITVKGDSMEPTLKEGDVILIDHRYNTLKNDSIYVLLTEGELIIKRLQKGLNQVIIVSDNPRYTPQYIDIHFSDDLIKIVGKVAWIGKML